MKKMSNICCFQLLEREDLLLFFVIYDSKCRVFGFYTAGWTQKHFEGSFFFLNDILKLSGWTKKLNWGEMSVTRREQMIDAARIMCSRLSVIWRHVAGKRLWVWAVDLQVWHKFDSQWISCSLQSIQMWFRVKRSVRVDSPRRLCFHRREVLMLSRRAGGNVSVFWGCRTTEAETILLQINSYMTVN